MDAGQQSSVLRNRVHHNSNFHQIVEPSKISSDNRPEKRSLRKIDENGDEVVDVSYKLQSGTEKSSRVKKWGERKSREKVHGYTVTTRNKSPTLKDGFVGKSDRSLPVMKAKSYLKEDMKSSNTGYGENSVENYHSENTSVNKIAGPQKIGGRIKVKKIQEKLKQASKSFLKEANGSSERANEEISGPEKESDDEYLALTVMRCKLVILILIQFSLIASTLSGNNHSWVLYGDGSVLSAASALQRKKKLLRHIPALLTTGVDFLSPRTVFTTLSGLMCVYGTCMQNAYAVVPIILLTLITAFIDFVDTMMITYYVRDLFGTSYVIPYILTVSILTGVQLYLCSSAFKFYEKCTRRNNKILVE